MKKKSENKRFSCVVLAAGRGENDPMAREFAVSHKCLLPIAGKPMITRVLTALQKSSSIGKTLISIEREDVLVQNAQVKKCLHTKAAAPIKSRSRASTSVMAATRELSFPILVTTADHALLSADMIEQFLSQAGKKNCAVAVGLVHENTITSRYPNVKRTYLRFNDGGYSGANLFALMNDDCLKVLEFWQHVERERKKPWKLISAFGLGPLLKWLTGSLSLAQAFEEASKKINAKVAPVILEDAHASIDVDKKSDHELVERILAKKV